ncbi:hypothetical protein EDB85DRAFT_1935816, partial [Lactarius pseudohatsudake]
MKASIQEQLKAIGIPYALFWTGPFADFIWVATSGLDVLSGKVFVGGDGSNPIPFTSRPDIARYLSYVLTHLPADQLKNRSFSIRGDTKVRAALVQCFQHRVVMEIFNQSEDWEESEEVTYNPASNPQDVAALLQKIWATPYHPETDNHLYPDWNPVP